MLNKVLLSTSKSSIIAVVASSITIVLAMHYWFSYLILCGNLELFGINPNPIISFDDIAFSFGETSFRILITVLAVIVPFLCLGLAWEPYNRWIRRKTTPPHKYGFTLNNHIKKSKKKFNWTTKHAKSANWVKLLKVCLFSFGIIVMISCGYFCYTAYQQIIAIEPKDYPLFFALLLFMLGSFFYIILPSQRRVILFFYIFGAFILGKIIIDNLFADKVKYKLPEKCRISFTYKERHITTGKSCGLVYNGYKYYVLYDTLEMRTYLFPTNEIEDLEYHHK